MQEIRNSRVARELREAAQLQLATDHLPMKLADYVMPTIEVNPRLVRVQNVIAHTSRSTTGTSTVYTVPSDRDFYLCMAQMSASFDATADSTNSFLTVTLDDGAANLRPIQLMKQTTTATAHNQAVFFNPPIKLKRGSTVGLNLSFTVGSGNGSANVSGYVVDNANG